MFCRYSHFSSFVFFFVFRYFFLVFRFFFCFNFHIERRVTLLNEHLKLWRSHAPCTYWQSGEYASDPLKLGQSICRFGIDIDTNAEQFVGFTLSMHFYWISQISYSPRLTQHNQQIGSDRITSYPLLNAMFKTFYCKYLT